MVDIITQQKMNNVDRDISDIGKALNTKQVITPRYGNPFNSLPLELDNLAKAIQIALAAGAGAAGWTDRLVQTWSGRTQEQKNKEKPSAQDFKAKGDGVTNDTLSFKNLEIDYQDRKIDLMGKTYVVDALPQKNIYTNGSFKIASELVKPQGEFIRNGNTGSTPINIRQDIRTPKLIGSLSRASGRGSGNVVQSFCIDDTNGYWYTLSAHESLGSFINRFRGFSYIGRSAMDKSDYHPMLGHQGLCMEYRGNDGEDRLWTSVGYEPSPPTEYAGKTVNYALSFVYKKIDDGLIDNTEFWKVNRTGFVGDSIF